MLTEIGFLAAAKSDVKHAACIFSALERIRPDGIYVYVGWACALMNAQQFDSAIAILERGVGRIINEDIATLHAFRALAFQLAGRSSESRNALVAASDCRLGLVMSGRI